jgi:hypothetical protein
LTIMRKPVRNVLDLAWYATYRMGMLTDFAAVVALWPSLSELAADLGIAYGVAKQWRRRNSIPADKWLALVAAAERRGFDGITLDLLAGLAQARSAEPEGRAA